MAPAITIQADVVDIRSARTAPAHLFVDTNAWFWHAYHRSSLNNSPWRRRQITFYTAFLTRVIQANGTLYHSGLQLAELLHLIEKTELEDYNYRTTSNLKPKEFRHGYPVERSLVVAEVQTAWAEVIKVSNLIDCVINPAMTQAALIRFAAQPLDGYDIYFIESLQQSRITTNVLTDDGDYATVPGITVYTANDGVIQAATSAGKLI